MCLLLECTTGDTQLLVGEGYIPIREPNNIRDLHAVTILRDGKKRAYLKREYAIVVSELMDLNLNVLWRLKQLEASQMVDGVPNKNVYWAAVSVTVM